MALDDNDMLDRALDAAEAKLAGLAEEPEPSEAPEESTISEEAPSEEKAAAPKTPERDRDESGKFVKSKGAKPSTPKQTKQDPDQAADVETQAAEEQSEESGQDAIPPSEAPMFWSAEEKAAFAKAPADIQRIITAKEAQRNEYVNRLANESQQARSIAEKLYKGFEPHRARLQLTGVKDPLEELDRYRAWDEIFRSDVKAGITDLMRKNGLTAYDFVEDQGQAQQYQTDPRVEQTYAEAQEAKRLAEELKQQLEFQKQAAANQYLETFKQGKGSQGEVRSQYFEFYRPHIVQAMGEILNAQPHMSEDQALNHAYEFVMQEMRKIHGTNGTYKNGTNGAVKDPQTIVAQAKKAQAAASSVTGAPSSGANAPRPRAKTIDEALDRAFERAGL